MRLRVCSRGRHTSGCCTWGTRRERRRGCAPAAPAARSAVTCRGALPPSRCAPCFRCAWRGGLRGGAGDRAQFQARSRPRQAPVVTLRPQRWGQLVLPAVDDARAQYCCASAAEDCATSRSCWLFLVTRLTTAHDAACSRCDRLFCNPKPSLSLSQGCLFPETSMPFPVEAGWL